MDINKKFSQFTVYNQNKTRDELVKIITEIKSFMIDSVNFNYESAIFVINEDIGEVILKSKKISDLSVYIKNQLKGIFYEKHILFELRNQDLDKIIYKIKTNEKNSNKSNFIEDKENFLWKVRKEDGSEEIVLNGLISSFGEVSIDHPFQVSRDRSTQNGIVLELKRSNGRTEYILESKTNVYSSKNISEVLNLYGLSFNTNFHLFPKFISDYLFKQSNGKISKFYTKYGRTTDGVIVYSDGVLKNGNVYKADKFGKIFLGDNEYCFLPNKICLAGFEKHLLLEPTSPYNFVYKDDFTELKLFLINAEKMFGKGIYVGLALEFFNCLFRRDEFGLIPFLYITGNTQSGKTFLAELIVNSFWGIPFHSKNCAAGTMSALHEQLTLNGLGIVCNEADKPEKDYAILDDGRHPMIADILTTASGLPKKNRNSQNRAVNGWFIFTGTERMTNNSQVINRLVELKIPQKSHLDDMHILVNKIKDGAHFLRLYITYILKEWSKDPKKYIEDFHNKNKLYKSKIISSFSEMNDNTHVNKWSNILSAGELLLPDYNHKIWEFITEELTISNSPKLNRLFSFLDDLSSAYLKLSYSNASFKDFSFDDNGIALWDRKTQTLKLNLNKGLGFLKNEKLLREPVKTASIYEILGIRNTKNKSEVLSLDYKWVRWVLLNDNIYKPCGFYRQSVLEFSLDEKNEMPNEVREYFFQIISQLEKQFLEKLV